MSAQPSARPAQGVAREPAPSPSGRLLLRMPPELHAELARAADGAGTSLNQFITTTLAGAVGLGEARPDGEADAPQPERGGPGLVLLVLAANAVVVGLAAILLVALLT